MRFRVPPVSGWSRGGQLLNEGDADNAGVTVPYGDFRSMRWTVLTSSTRSLGSNAKCTGGQLPLRWESFLSNILKSTVPIFYNTIFGPWSELLVLYVANTPTHLCNLVRGHKTGDGSSKLLRNK